MINKIVEILEFNGEIISTPENTYEALDRSKYEQVAQEIVKLFAIPDVTNRTCSFCGGTDFETTESQYNDVDNDYDRCEITQVLNAMAEKDTIICYNSEIPNLYGNLKTLCEDIGVSYSTYSKKQFPFKIGDIDVFKLPVKRGEKKEKKKT